MKKKSEKSIVAVSHLFPATSVFAVLTVSAVSAALAVLAVSAVLAGCGKKPEVVITADGSDLTEPSKEYETLSASTAEPFSYDDLQVGAVRYGMNEEQVIGLLGEPANIYDYNGEHAQEGDNPEEQAFLQKVYSYNELTLIFTEMNDTYLLTAAASVGESDVFSRGLKVGNKVEDILDAYYRDQDCYSRAYYSQDQTVRLGSYLYGNFTMEDLDAVKTADRIQYGLISYNGYSSIETAESYIIEMTCFEPPYQNETASVNDDFAQIAFDIDQNGNITAIRWYYYPEEG